MTLIRIIDYLDALFAFLAAVFWFISAYVRTPASFSISVEISEPGFGGGAGLGTGYSLDLFELGKALKRQSRWSSVAAICAGMAAILMAIVIPVGP